MKTKLRNKLFLSNHQLCCSCTRISSSRYEKWLGDETCYFPDCPTWILDTGRKLEETLKGGTYMNFGSQSSLVNEQIKLILVDHTLLTKYAYFFSWVSINWLIFDDLLWIQSAPVEEKDEVGKFWSDTLENGNPPTCQSYHGERNFELIHQKKDVYFQVSFLPIREMVKFRNQGSVPLNVSLWSAQACLLDTSLSYPCVWYLWVMPWSLDVHQGDSHWGSSTFISDNTLSIMRNLVWIYSGTGCRKKLGKTRINQTELSPIW